MILTNLVIHQAALLVATDLTYAAIASDELVLLLLDLHAHGYALAGIFFGLWLLPVGYIGYRSGLLPKVLSILVVVSGVAWIVETLVGFSFPDLPGFVQEILAAPRFVEGRADDLPARQRRAHLPSWPAHASLTIRTFRAW